MRALLRPAVLLLGRLRYAQKFSVVGLVLLLPLGFVVNAYVDLQRERIAFSSLERVGVAYLGPLIQLTAAAVESRHLAVLGEPNDGRGLESAIARVDAVDARYGVDLGSTGRWRAARANLLTAPARASEDGFAHHNRAVTELLGLVVHVGDMSNLTLDPDLDTYYLMDTLQFRLPVILDVSGRMTDRAVLAGRDPRMDPTNVAIELGLDNGVLGSTRETVASGLATAARNTTSEVLPRLATDGFGVVDEEVRRVRQVVTSATRARRPAAVDGGTADALRAETERFAADVAGELDRLLAIRIAGFTQSSRGVTAVGLLAALLAIYLFLGFYMSVSAPVQRLVTALRAVAQGELSARVQVDTRDELSFVGRVLNDTLETTERATQRLAHQATHDALTGLPNRVLVLRRVHEALTGITAQLPHVGVLFADLDGFKVINDSLGHDAGDFLLREVAVRLQRAARADDTVGRLAGDEFVVVSPGLRDRDDAQAFAERLLALLAEPVVVPIRNGASRQVNLGASLGITVATSPDSDPDELVRQADMAMYRAKKLGRGRWEMFDERLAEEVAQRLDTREELRRGIADDRLRLHYQPIVELATGRTALVEALVRWEHPERGLLLPAEFLDVAEETGLIVPLGTWVLEEACRRAAAWHRQPGPAAGLSVAVNLSAVQIADPQLIPTIARVLAQTGMPPDALWLEITETAVMSDVRSAVRTLEAIRRLGVHLSIDDFGTGYSSLAQLRRFPVETIKIDRSFVAGLGDSAEDEAIVELIADLARRLGLRAVAEGVEQPQQLARLKRMGLHYAQGFLLGRPQTEAALLSTLNRRLLVPQP